VREKTTQLNYFSKGIWVKETLNYSKSSVAT